MNIKPGRAVVFIIILWIIAAFIHNLEKQSAQQTPIAQRSPVVQSVVVQPAAVQAVQVSQPLPVQSSAPTYPIVRQVQISRNRWTEIDWQEGEVFNGDVLESNVAIVGRTEKYGPPNYWMPTKDSHLNRQVKLGRFVHMIQIHISADSVADTGTYQYTITR